MNEKRTHGEKENVNEMNLDVNEPLCVAACCASSVSLREYDRTIANYDRLRMAVLNKLNDDDPIKVADGYELLRTDWKVEER